MHMKTWAHEGVKKDGTFVSGKPGAVVVNQGVDWLDHEVSGLPVMRICLGRDKDGAVRGITVFFDSDQEAEPHRAWSRNDF